jgi:hypothetical protein
MGRGHYWCRYPHLLSLAISKVAMWLGYRILIWFGRRDLQVDHLLPELLLDDVQTSYSEGTSLIVTIGFKISELPSQLSTVVIYCADICGVSYSSLAMWGESFGLLVNRC